MLRTILGLLFMLGTTIGVANNDVDADVIATQKVINATVWKTFQNAFNTLDGEALNSVYADNVLRVTPDALDTQNQFKHYNKKRFQENISKRDRVELDFWFDSRHTNDITSYEVGFYRMAVTTSTGTQNKAPLDAFKPLF